MSLIRTNLWCNKMCINTFPLFNYAQWFVNKHFVILTRLSTMYLNKNHISLLIIRFTCIYTLLYGFGAFMDDIHYQFKELQVQFSFCFRNLVTATLHVSKVWCFKGRCIGIQQKLWTCRIKRFPFHSILIEVI